jgi:very-short-patch-repair endonuclease
LQHEIIDRDGRLWRVDFAWPEQGLIVEYDGFDWHSSPAGLLRDRQKRAALQELDWRVLSIVSDDVRRHPDTLLRRIDGQLRRSAA